MAERKDIDNGSFDAKGDLLAGTGNDTFAALAVGADGTEVVADANSASGFKYAKRFGQPTYLANGYYGCGGNGQSTAGGWTLNALYAVPIFISRRQAFDRIGVRCGAGTATLVVRLGIFNDNNGPTTVVLDAGTVDGASASADKVITIAQTLDPGMYWLAGCPQVAATIGAGFLATKAGYTQFLPYPWSSVLVTPPRGFVRTAGPTGAFGTITPALADFSVSSEAMNVMLRAA